MGNDEDLQMAEKRVACEYISHYLGMGFDPMSIEKTKFGRNNTLYIQLLDKDNALELLKRGGIARKKNQDLKVTNYIPPQVFDRYIGAINYTKKIKEKNPENFFSVRLGTYDIRLLSKNSHDEDWRMEVVPSDIPKFNNNISWEGLSNTKQKPNIEDFSPMKGMLPSEITLDKSLEKANDLKRKDVSPLANGAKK